jgi:hypothetical protein
MRRAPVVIDFREHGLKGRDLMLGIQAFGASRAFPYDQVIREKLVQDRVGAEPVLLVVGPDGQSVRAFRRRIPGIQGAPDFYRKPDGVLWTPQLAVSGTSRAARSRVRPKARAWRVFWRTGGLVIAHYYFYNITRIIGSSWRKSCIGNPSTTVYW